MIIMGTLILYVVLGFVFMIINNIIIIIEQPHGDNETAV